MLALLPDHIRMNRPALAVLFDDLFVVTREGAITPIRGAMQFLAARAYQYRITVVDPHAHPPHGVVNVWDMLRNALTDYYDGDAMAARTLLVELSIDVKRAPDCLFIGYPTNGKWEVRNYVH